MFAGGKGISRHLRVLFVVDGQKLHRFYLGEQKSAEKRRITDHRGGGEQMRGLEQVY